jgi:hypothetical protein
MNKVCYIIQTYKNPQQIERLIDRITIGNSRAEIIVNHDFSHCNLKLPREKNGSKIRIFAVKGGRANFSLIQSYLSTVDWLLSNEIEFDWLINLTGQDYPILAIAEIEDFLASTSYDAFLEYVEVFSDLCKWGTRESQSRYCYKYKQLIADLSDRQKDLLRPLKVVNYIQPFFRINFAYGLTVGVKTTTPFSEDFLCYGGSYFCTLSRQCVEYLDKFTKANPELVNFYRNVSLSSESFLQTILVNSKLFNICNDGKRYYDFSKTRHGSPSILTSDCYQSIVNSDDHFARKFDMKIDSNILDLLDEKIVRSRSLDTVKSTIASEPININNNFQT